MSKQRGIFCISLDFELFWGMQDVVTTSEFVEIAKKTKEKAIPAILDVFKNNNIHATWATVGGLMAKDKNDFINNSPEQIDRPSYENAERSSYRLISDHSDVLVDEMLFVRELIEKIKSYPNQEIGTHTYSHYYCNEKGQTIDQFSADIDAAIAIDNINGIQTKSIVFPRNQVERSYLKVCRSKGITAYRGIESNWIYNKIKWMPIHRILRFLDTYFSISGSNVHELEIVSGMVNIVGSRIFRPYNNSLRILEPLKIKRIKKQMLNAAKEGKVFHLWWHPHNFGTFLEKNISNLEKIINFYNKLKEQYGFETLNMGEIADRLRLGIKKTYAPVSSDRADEAAQIYNLVFNGEATGKTIQVKHFENPAACKSQMHGAYDENKLIGINGFLDMEYVYNGIKLKAIQSCDTAVDPFYRNQGVFTSIIKDKEKQLIAEGYDLIVGYPNFNSYPGFLKMGWIEVTRTSKLFLPVNAQIVIKHMLGINPTKLANIISNLLWWKIKRIANNDNTITVEKKMSVTLSEYEKCIDKSKIYFMINDEMLKWKLTDMTGHFIISKNKNFIGRIITARTDYKDGMRRTNLIAYHFDIDDQKEIEIAYAKVLYMLHDKFDIICIWQPQDKIVAEALHKLHFLNNVATKQGSPFIIKILTKDPEKLDIINNKSLWNPCQIETDTMVNL